MSRYETHYSYKNEPSVWSSHYRQPEKEESPMLTEKVYLNVHTNHGDLWRGDIDLGDGVTLNVTITQEGIIMDHYVGEIGEVVSTVGMTFDEWTDWMRGS